MSEIWDGGSVCVCLYVCVSDTDRGEWESGIKQGRCWGVWCVRMCVCPCPTAPFSHCGGRTIGRDTLFSGASSSLLARCSLVSRIIVLQDNSSQGPHPTWYPPHTHTHTHPCTHTLWVQLQASLPLRSLRGPTKHSPHSLLHISTLQHRRTWLAAARTPDAGHSRLRQNEGLSLISMNNKNKHGNQGEKGQGGNPTVSLN